ncbi:MAG: carboxypeptidase-like regulatory domain-containing protein [Planctomycetaceae bacterium]|jgi:hypothetical protein|nr:carboxypeptidase-like regulatory domain-containing protein [Planctomycetaceae bacterium]
MKLDLSVLFSLLCFGILSGCSDRVHVSGKVLLRSGEPVTKGLVLFENEKLSGIGNIQTDGSYSIGLLKPGEGIPPGTYSIAIQATGTMGGVKIDETSASSNKIPEIVEETSQVDMKYALPRTSGLVVTVEAGKPMKHDIIVDAPKH